MADAPHNATGTRPQIGKMKWPDFRSAGRKVDTWHFSTESEKLGELIFEVVVNHDKQGFYFTANCAQLKKEPDLRSDNLNELRKLAEEAAARYIYAKVGVKWEQWLKVTVEGRSEKHGLKTDTPTVGGLRLDVKYEPILRGIDPTGKAVTVNQFGRVVPFPLPTSAAGFGAMDSKEIVMDDTHSGAETSYIPYSPENVASLEEIQMRMEMLRVALSKLLSQDHIEENLPKMSMLGDFAGLQLLDGPRS